jgi:flagellar biosynthesis/type III secretory pathway protein FliH
VLSALLHAQEEGAEKVALAAFVGVEELEQAEERDMWRELVAQALQSNEVAKKALEAMMNVQTWREKSIWFQDGRKEGRKEGFQDGRKEGMQQGKAEAREAVKDLCEILAIELGTERLQALEAMDLPALAALRKHLKTHRTWPPEGA